MPFVSNTTGTERTNVMQAKKDAVRTPSTKRQVKLSIKLASLKNKTDTWFNYAIYTMVFNAYK